MDIGIDFFSYSNLSDSNYTQILINETSMYFRSRVHHKRHKNHVNSNQRTSPVTKPGP